MYVNIPLILVLYTLRDTHCSFFNTYLYIIYTHRSFRILVILRRALLIPLYIIFYFFYEHKKFPAVNLCNIITSFLNFILCVCVVIYRVLFYHHKEFVQQCVYINLLPAYQFVST